MAKSWTWKKLLPLSALAVLLLAPFSTALPCLSLPGLLPLAWFLSATMETMPFFAYVIALAYYQKKSGKGNWKSTVLEAVFLNIVVLVLKYALNRPRPVPLHTPGYPSGHAARAFWLAFKLGEVSRSLELIALLYAVLVSWSRIELCVHYPLDVVGGFLVAVLVRGVWEAYVEPKLGRCGGPAGI